MSNDQPREQRMFDVYGASDKKVGDKLTVDMAWLFRSNSEGIRQILNLYPEGVRRIETETQAGGICILHGNRTMVFRNHRRFIVAAAPAGDTINPHLAMNA